MDPDPEAVIDALLLQQARLAGDLVQIDEETWAIHASLPFEGEVIVAEAHSVQDAQTLLDRWSHDPAPDAADGHDRRPDL